MAKIIAPPKEIEVEVRTQLEPLFLEFYRGSKMYKAYVNILRNLLKE